MDTIYVTPENIKTQTARFTNILTLLALECCIFQTHLHNSKTSIQEYIFSHTTASTRTHQAHYIKLWHIIHHLRVYKLTNSMSIIFNNARNEREDHNVKRPGPHILHDDVDARDDGRAHARDGGRAHARDGGRAHENAHAHDDGMAHHNGGTMGHDCKFLYKHLQDKQVEDDPE